MTHLPLPPSPFFLGPRSKSTTLALDIAEVLAQDFYATALKKKLVENDDDQAVSLSHQSASPSDISMDDDTASNLSMDSSSEISASDSDSGLSMSDASDAPTSPVDSDDDYRPSKKGSLAVTRSYALRARNDSAALPDHLSTALPVETALFVDEQDRVGALYIGWPVPNLLWQQTVIKAGDTMLDALKCLRISDEGGPPATPPEMIESGVQCHGLYGNRPQNVSGLPITMVHVALAGLRDSPAIQAIASFQNAMLRRVAPRAWETARLDIERVLKHDTRLRLPFHLPYARGMREATAFAHVEYRFVTDGFPRRERAAQSSGMTMLTALGDYDPNEGELILWEDQKVINFPSGSSFMLPKWMHYSFTAVEAPGPQMIMVQSCDEAVSQFVANDFSCINFEEGTEIDQDLLMQLAQAAAAKPIQYDEAPGGGHAPPRPPPKKQKPLGATADNPLLVNENGEFVAKLGSSPSKMLSPRKASTSTVIAERRSPGGGIIYPGIMGGPPLLIKSTAPLRSVLPTRTTTTTRAARAAATAGPSQQASRRRSAPRSPRPVDRTRALIFDVVPLVDVPIVIPPLRTTTPAGLTKVKSRSAGAVSNGLSRAPPSLLPDSP
ncbi:hypothetical protein B0H16DRAFT_1457621 [Mycena metata]|uniref:Uncharacterized protein n=1 Tax=Mycena metata TaxID=1033252 RepID=A0AAD7J6D8_9AGAR|nr:hypothetical protein B0H16DRAFT_1457621 [Mycena metata]